MVSRVILHLYKGEEALRALPWSFEVRFTNCCSGSYFLLCLPKAVGKSLSCGSFAGFQPLVFDNTAMSGLFFFHPQRQIRFHQNLKNGVGAECCPQLQDLRAAALAGGAPSFLIAWGR